MLRIVKAKKEDFKYAEEVSDELHDCFIYCLSQNEKEPLRLLFFDYASSIKNYLTFIEHVLNIVRGIYHILEM